MFDVTSIQNITKKFNNILMLIVSMYHNIAKLHRYYTNRTLNMNVLRET